MQLAEATEQQVPIQLELSGVPLTVVFADGEAIKAAHDDGSFAILLDPPFHVSDEDAYLVLPSDIGMEILDIFGDADAELLDEALRDGLLVIGAVERSEDGDVHLLADEVMRPGDALRSGMPYHHRCEIAPESDCVSVINGTPGLQCTMASRLLDEETFERILAQREFIGCSWKAPEGAPPDQQGDPTYAWTKHLGPGRIGIEMALFHEYEELIVVFRPLEMTAKV
ncbi:MAG: hypothetical protein KC416_15795, partial [Myxococcales bacterium]|nr:hypothetical protein [Myxococcales bacterium]